MIETNKFKIKFDKLVPGDLITSHSEAVIWYQGACIVSIVKHNVPSYSYNDRVSFDVVFFRLNDKEQHRIGRFSTSNDYVRGQIFRFGKELA